MNQIPKRSMVRPVLGGFTATITAAVFTFLLHFNPDHAHGPADIWFPGPVDLLIFFGLPILNVASTLYAMITGLGALSASNPRVIRQRGACAFTLGVVGLTPWVVIVSRWYFR